MSGGCLAPHRTGSLGQLLSLATDRFLASHIVTVTLAAFSEKSQEDGLKDEGSLRHLSLHASLDAGFLANLPLATLSAA